MRLLSFARLSRLLIIVAIASMLLIPASATFADGAVTETWQVRDFTDTHPDSDRCSGVEGDVTITFSGVIHMTTTPNGAYHERSTWRGDAYFVPYDPSLPTQSGKFRTETFTILNSKTESHLWNFKVHVERPDGTKVQWEELWRANMNANGEWVVEFYKLVCPR